jgi:hypothetical protein
MKPLSDIRVVSLALNLPGPLAAARLVAMGASVVKAEPPSGDPLFIGQPDWYHDLHAGIEVISSARRIRPRWNNISSNATCCSHRVGEMRSLVSVSGGRTSVRSTHGFVKLPSRAARVLMRIRPVTI